MKAEVHYHIHKSLLLDPILNSLNPVCTLTSYFLRVNFNFILPVVPKYLKYFLLTFWSSFLCISHKTVWPYSTSELYQPNDRPHVG
jgi:hypothetical protein